MFGAEPVADDGADHGAGQVEEVDDGVPAEDSGQAHAVASSVDPLVDGGRIDTKCVA